MDVPAEILWSGLACGFTGMGVALRLVYAHASAQTARIEAALGAQIAALSARISAMDEQLAKASAFERETLIGLIQSATSATDSTHAAGARLTRMIELLRQRYGEDALRLVEAARTQAAHEQSDTHVIHRSRA